MGRTGGEEGGGWRQENASCGRQTLRTPPSRRSLNSAFDVTPQGVTLPQLRDSTRPDVTLRDNPLARNHARQTLRR